MNPTSPAQVGWAVVVAALSGCATYEPDPIDPTEVLDRLEAIEWVPATDETSFDEVPSAAGPRELAAFAVSRHPELTAARAEVGLRQALLIEAGLLPDPEIGWDGMDVLAAQMVDGTFTSAEVISGFGLMFPLLRPGEREARVGAAAWSVEEARRRIATAEWSLTRDVHVAFEEAQAAIALQNQTRALTELARSTADYFERARVAGAATAIQANLARGELQAIRLDGVRAEARERQARQSLNALLGLPPAAEVPLGGGDDPSENTALRAGTHELTSHAVEARPDLSALLAAYQAAEEEVRLAVSKQYPRVSIGTGISVTPPLFSGFGRPEIATAVARRDERKLEFTAAVHAARREIAAAHTLWELARREVAIVEDELLPNAERSLLLSREAVEAGEATLLETLALQNALVDARTRRVEARAERAKRAWVLLAASGWLVGPERTNHTNDTNEEGGSK